MLTILNLFGRSPFAPLRSHMETVARCVHKLPALFDALEMQNHALVEKIASEISDLEHQADLIKNDIRNHLPKSLYLPIDRTQLLEILAIQDHLADKAEDIAVLSTLKTIELFPSFKEEFKLFLSQNIQTFDGAELIVKELHELIETSFGGREAEKVRAMVEEVAYREHEVDLIQRQLLKIVFSSDNQMTFTSFYQWQKIIECVACLSNLAENLADRVRMTLDLKSK